MSVQPAGGIVRKNATLLQKKIYNWVVPITSPILCVLRLDEGPKNKTIWWLWATETFEERRLR